MVFTTNAGFLLCVVFTGVFSTTENDDQTNPTLSASYRWECINSKCEKFAMYKENARNSLSLEVCKMFCGDDANIWPKPTGNVRLSSKLVHVDVENIQFSGTVNGAAINLLKGATKRFSDRLKQRSKGTNLGKNSLIVEIFIKNENVTKLTLDTDESYYLSTSLIPGNNIKATINSETFFGARHALETLDQLIVYDNVRNELQILSDSDIDDQPAYKYRGILLDTSRNYYTIESIKRTIDGMAASKLNTFHWHITDSHSFPFVSKSQPKLSQLGAYSAKQVYKPSDIRDIVRYGLERGVRILPEFDAPAHVGEGWQETDMTVCFKAEPWRDYCVEPPCGQLNPTKLELYDILNGIYNDMFDLFEPDIFHMGGDEVSTKCWNSSAEIRQWITNRRLSLDDDAFIQLWKYFQDNASKQVYKVNGGKKLPLIMWTSGLTASSQVQDILPVEDYIIQIWTKGDDAQIKKLLLMGYQIIMSNYDALYLDCGFSTWVGAAGNNWCSPYIGWQKVYDNNLAELVGSSFNHLVLGGEAALWSEQSDTSTLDGRLWPRAAALAERLWTNPTTPWEDAEQRMLHFRERLVDMGIAADSIQPQWCLQNQGHCY